MSPVTVFYYVLTAYLAILAGWNFAKTRDLKEAAMYVIVMTPLILRVFRIK
ncbi:MAG: hypothetical protein NUW23_00485 [Firmicutes bacterium]|jgi:hypothetical protein|nr:hypothetical protein [Bacillota bacterium]